MLCFNSLSWTVFKNLCTKLLDSPLSQHTLLFPTWSFVLGISPIKKKMSFPSSHLFKWCPSLNTQTKAILISFPWILQCEMIYPFSELPQCLLGWFSECVSETTSFKNAPESVFLQRPEEALAIFPLLSQIYFATLRRISKPHIMERGRLTRLIVAGVIHWLISIIPFCSHFHTQNFYLSCVFVRSVMSLLTAEFAITKRPPLCFSTIASQFHGRPLFWGFRCCYHFLNNFILHEKECKQSLKWR